MRGSHTKARMGGDLGFRIDPAAGSQSLEAQAQRVKDVAECVSCSASQPEKSDDLFWNYYEQTRRPRRRQSLMQRCQSADDV